jgi:hypothetical protein
MTEHLNDTYWCVPKATLLAYSYVNTDYSKVTDQTIWHIKTADRGYIMGIAYVYINGSPTSKMDFIGSVTPSGRVLIEFYSSGASVQGTGEFIDGSYFVMQMNELISLTNAKTGLSHWSYMRPVHPTSRAWRSLPGAGISVPEFIASFDQKA